MLSKTKIVKKFFPLFLLFLIVALIYFSGLLHPEKRRKTNSDTWGYVFTPISLIKERNFDLNEFVFLYQEVMPHFAVKTQQDKLIAYAPPMGSLIQLPIYIFWYGFLGKKVFIEDLYILAKINAVIVSAMSVVIFYLSANSLTTKNNSLLLTTIYGFASSIWSIASQTFWQHTSSVFFLTLSLYFLLRSRKEKRFLGYLGLPISLASCSRFSNILPAVIIFLYLLLKERKWLPQFIFYSLPGVLGLAVFNWYHFGNPFSYAYLHIPKESLVKYGFFILPFWQGLSNLFFSPSRGLFVFSPIFLFSFWGAIASWKKLVAELKLVSLLALGQIFTASSYGDAGWGGPLFWGPRFATEIIPFLTILIIPIMGKLRNQGFLKALFIISLFYSVSIQALGAYVYNYEWDEFHWDPKKIKGGTTWQRDMRVIWQIKDSQVLFTLKKALNIPFQPLDIK